MPELRAEGGEEALDALRASVREARAAAERLAAEAGVPLSAETTPPAGWAEEPGGHPATGELRALLDLIESLRRLLPDELREQLAELARQLLLVLRALIDWLVGRIEREGRGAEPEVEDIPIS